MMQAALFQWDDSSVTNIFHTVFSLQVEEIKRTEHNQVFYANMSISQQHHYFALKECQG